MGRKNAANRLVDARAAHADTLRQIGVIEAQRALRTQDLRRGRAALCPTGADQNDLFRLAASYVDRILRGDKPTELPTFRPRQGSRQLSTSRPRRHLVLMYRPTCSLPPTR